MPIKRKAGTRKASSSTGSTGFKKADSVISRRNQNGTVILMKLDQASSFYKIDGIAADVWMSIEKPKTLESMIEHFAQRYPAKAKSMGREIETLIRKLAKLELLEQTKGPFDRSFPSASQKPSDFGKVQEFDLEMIESEVLNESVYLDVFAGSDLRLKSHVTPIKGALARICELEGITHRWKDGHGSVHAGLIAQQVAEQMPELVRADEKSGYLAVEYQKLSAYLVEAIKDLNRVVGEQGKRIRSLEAQALRRGSRPRAALTRAALRG